MTVLAARKNYSKEFKLDAVSLTLEQGYTRAAAAKNLLNTLALFRITFTCALNLLFIWRGLPLL